MAPVDSTVDRLPEWAVPSAILNPQSTPGASWALALAAGDEQQAVTDYVADLRRRPFLPDPDYAYIALAERWNGIRFAHHGGHDYDPDDVVRQRYVGVYGIEHTFEGEIDWLFDPTRDWGSKQTWEWVVQFNRHYHWVSLAQAWKQTGQEKYVRAFERELISWVSSQCPAPPRKDMRLPGTWRTIDAGIRAGWTWPLVLDIFRQADGAGDRAIWLMVAAMREHGRYLLMSPTGGNFKTMENNGLAHVGMLLPSLLDAELYAGTAIDRAIAEMERQFYPDGCQDELAPSYGRLSMSCTFCTFKLAQNVGLDTSRGSGITPWLWDKLRTMASVYGRLATPDGWVPELHDSPAMPAAPQHDDVAALPSAAGQSQARPWREDGATLIPWGGYGILRNQGHWALLDGGPWGTGHQHSDALQVITWGGGGFWCVDPGKPLYNKSRATRLIRSAEGHNVVLMDGQRHLPEPLLNRITRPLPMAVASGTHASVTAAARMAREESAATPAFRHQRMLMVINGMGWLIVDRLCSVCSGTHGWEWLWHFPVGAGITVDDRKVTVDRQDGARLHVSAAAGDDLDLTALAGSEDPFRGWFVDPETYRVCPLPLLVVRHRMTADPVWCATLMTERKAMPLDLKAHDDGLTVAFSGHAGDVEVSIDGQETWGAVSIACAGQTERLPLAAHAFPEA